MTQPVTRSAVGRAAKNSKGRKPSKKRLSKEEKALARVQRAQKTEVRNIFAAAGFERVAGAADVQFTFEEMTSDFDDVFVSSNVVVLVEYTTTKSSNVSEHIKKKDLLYKAIVERPAEFIEFAEGLPLRIQTSDLSEFAKSQIQVRILYCSREKVDGTLKNQIGFIKYFDYEIVKYFQSLTRAIKLSARTELLAFLGVEHSQYGSAALKSVGAASSDVYQGSVLPEEHSHFPPGFKVVSFYMDPDSLLKRAYVLRRDGWREGGAVYQRLIVRNKIEALRNYLINQERVFVNNIIVTLPAATRIVDPATGHTIQTDKLTETSQASISIPSDFNSIGVIDGQHRLYSYHEGGTDEAKIGRFRRHQNLLVTGVIYPQSYDETHKERFEARLFLEINSNQTNAKSDLRQAINRILNPYADASIALSVLDRLNDHGPLNGLFQRYVFENRLLKTTTVVSYGLRPLVKISAPRQQGRSSTVSRPIYDAWPRPSKAALADQADDDLLRAYVEYCATQIEAVFLNIRLRLGPELWSIKKRGDAGILSTTLINGILGAIRQALEAGIEIEDALKADCLDGIEGYDFSKFKSSQYTVMSTDIARRFFGVQT